MRDTLLKLGFLGFMGGVFLRSFVFLGNFAYMALFLGIGGGLLLWGVFRLRRVLVVSFLIFCFVLGAVRYAYTEYHPNPALAGSLDTKVVVEGVISEEPDVRDTHANVIVDIDTLTIGDVHTKIHERMFVGVSSYPHLSYGDRVELSGKLEVPENFTDGSTGKEFDYVHYLAKDGIGYSMSYPYVTIVSHDNGNRLKAMLFGAKHAFVDALARVVPDPESSLGAGVLVGGKQSLGTQLLDDFRTAGVVHIVVLSGYNVTIVAESLMSIFTFLPRMFALALGSGSVVLFAIMVGAGATVVRASVMALIVVLARVLGRGYRMDRALYFAAGVMVYIDPSILAFDPSFQLSFLATAGILYLAPLMEKYISFVTKKWGVRSIVASTLATQIFVLPVLIYETGKFSLVGLPANLFILPFVPLAMLASLCAGLAGFLGNTIAFPFAFVAYAVLLYIVAVTQFFAGLPFASMAVTSMPFAVVAIVYILYALGIRYAKKHQRSDINSKTKFYYDI